VEVSDIASPQCACGSTYFANGVFSSSQGDPGHVTWPPRFFVFLFGGQVLDQSSAVVYKCHRVMDEGGPSPRTPMCKTALFTISSDTKINSKAL